MTPALLLICPAQPDEGINHRLNETLDYALEGISYDRASTLAELPTSLQGRRILFALPLGAYGINMEYVRLLDLLRRTPGMLKDCIAGLVVDGDSPLYTKSAACELALAANMAGCAFVGRPLVEATDTLSNFHVIADTMSVTPAEAYRACARTLAEQVRDFHPVHTARPTLLALHASTQQTSNTMALWRQLQKRIANWCDIEEIGLRNGALTDCSGCPYTTCLHFGERGGCFYGGVMVDEVYPAVRRAHGLLMLCPNYNDALSANLSAFINRLTALFRQVRFYDKALFGIIVSGYSGGDVLARQLISALNMNKSFFLPPHFAMIETANQAGEALTIPDIEQRLNAFAKQMRTTLLG